MSTPPWLEIMQNLSKDYPREHTQVLATLTETGLPCSRYIGHRFIHLSKCNPHQPLLIATTDVRTPKSTHLSLNPHCNVTWRLPTPNVEFHLDGIGRVFGHKQRMSSGEDAGGEEDWEGTRREVWKTIRPDMKAGFVRPVAPGKAIDSYEEMDGWVQSLPELEEAKDEEERQLCLLAYRNFCLLIFEPKSVDYIEFGVDPNRRTAWSLDNGEWKKRILCP